MKKKKIILLMFTLFFQLMFLSSCGRKDLRRDFFTVAKIISGNRIKLINGYEVGLIGVDDDVKARKFLKETLPGRKIRFVFDSHCPLDVVLLEKINLFYAYVVTEKGWCVNSEILKKGLADIAYSHTHCLNDSLNVYENYMINGDWEDPDDFSKYNDNSINELYYK